MFFLGFFRDASSIVHEWERTSPAFLANLLVIDFNPRAIQELRRRGVDCIYGDIAHIDTLHHAGIHEAKLVVCSITDEILRGITNLHLLRNLKRVCPEAKIVVTSEHISQAMQLYDAGADFVYVPRLYSAAEMARLLKTALNRGFPHGRAEGVMRLRERREILD